MSTEQWPMTVALIFGFFAKEVVIGALGGLFLPLSNLSEQWLYQPYQNSQQWFEKIYQSNFSELSSALIWENSPTLDQVNISLSNFFNDKLQIMAWLIFILLYLPCVSTFAVIKKTW